MKEFIAILIIILIGIPYVYMLYDIIKNIIINLWENKNGIYSTCITFFTNWMVN